MLLRDYDWQYLHLMSDKERRAVERQEIFITCLMVFFVLCVGALILWLVSSMMNLAEEMKESNARLAECTDAYIAEGRDLSTAWYICEREAE